MQESPCRSSCCEEGVEDNPQHVCVHAHVTLQDQRL